VETSAQNYYIR